MARGRDQHRAHLDAVAALGRPLARRARSRCELCEDKGALHVCEVDGNPDEEPSEAWALLLCARCEALVTGSTRPTETLRFLETACWSTLQPAQLCAVRLLRAMASEVVWAQDTLDSLYLDEAVEALI
jgi:protein PhnA